MYYICNTIIKHNYSMIKYKLIAKSKKGFHTVTLCKTNEYAEMLKKTCEKHDKKRTYEIIEIDNQNKKS